MSTETLYQNTDYNTIYNNLTEVPYTRSDIILTMQKIAPPGQEVLDTKTHHLLNHYTKSLLSLYLKSNMNDYNRYESTEQRQIKISEEHLKNVHQNKTILVTGGTGLIGTKLMAELSKFNPSNIISVSRGLTIPLNIIDGVNYLHADIRDATQINNIFSNEKPDIVYHVAAQKYPGLAEEMVIHTLSTNITGTKNILNAVKNNDVERIIYASTGKTIRLFTPDTYAASKKISEWLLSTFATANPNILCSAARFTHVVDHSDIKRKLQTWIDTDQPIKLHGPEIMFYVQSAIESAQLLMNSTLDSNKGTLQIDAIRDLGYPISLTDLSLGLINKNNNKGTLYFSGYTPGYEEEVYANTYDPKSAGEVSPLINALEARVTKTSDYSKEVDTFPLSSKQTPQSMKNFQALEQVYNNQSDKLSINSLKNNLSWTILEAQLLTVPTPIIERLASQVQKNEQINHKSLQNNLINQMILNVFKKRFNK